MENVLIIFAKNPVYGRVKTRLAAIIGHDRALQVYRALLCHTANITRDIDASRIVYFSDFTDNDDNWDQNYLKSVQEGADLGERMANAFREALCAARKAVIIGTDCADLDELTIRQAFDYLDYKDIVIGPAADGGYYLLGTKLFYPWLFSDMPWSTAAVFEETVRRCNDHGLQYHSLPIRHDVDQANDLKYLS